MMKPHLLFFDLDGTISDTEPDIRAAWLAGIAALGLECPAFDSVFRVGPSLPETAKMLFPAVSGELREKIMVSYKKYYDDADSYTALPYPGMIEVMKELAGRGCKIFAVTNKRFKPTKKLMEKFGLLSALCGIVTPDIVSPEYLLSKPDMVKLALRISALDVPQLALMVGDTEIDINAGKANGLSTCGVTWGYALPGVLEKSAPDYIIDAPAELLTLL